MKIDLPKWAIKKASREDYQLTLKAFNNGTGRIIWPIGNAIRVWAKEQGWTYSWIFFKTRFQKKYLKVKRTLF